MRNKTGKIDKRGQSLIEYGLILGVVTMALIGMQTYFKRSLQAVAKVIADDYGPQHMPIRQAEVNIKTPLYAAQGQITNNTTITNNLQVKTTHNSGDSNIRTNDIAVTAYQNDSYFVSGNFRDQ